MLKTYLKTQTPTLLDSKVKQIVQNIIWKCDTLREFKGKFLARIKTEAGMGDNFQKLYYVTLSDDKAQVWRRKNDGEISDRLIFDIVSITYS